MFSLTVSIPAPMSAADGANLVIASGNISSLAVKTQNLFAGSSYEASVDIGFAPYKSGCVRGGDTDGDEDKAAVIGFRGIFLEFDGNMVSETM